MNIYEGLKEKAKPKIFEAEKEPTKETHPQFDMTFGHFKSLKDAERYISAMNQGVACSEG